MTDPTSTRDALELLEVPPHDQAFWTELDVALGQSQGTPVVGLRSRRNRPVVGSRIAAAAALVVVAGIGSAVWFSAERPDRPAPVSETPQPSDAGTPATTDPVGTATSTSTTPTTSATPATTTAGESATAAPWLVALAIDEVPAVLADEWRAAENRAWCPALYPDVADSSPGRLRAADFGGGWAVSWDLPDGPGSALSGELCEDCGRSAFGVAGAGLTATPDTGVRMPSVLHFDDGAVAGYTGEGFDPDNPKRLAEISIPGHGCVYQVWSHLGDAHLVQLILSLRTVEGLSEGVTKLRTVEDIEYIEGGAAPWSATPVPAAGPDVNAALVLSNPATIVGPATARTVNGYSWGTAWDAPSGPGHDSLNRACANCGRGVVGVVGQAGPPITPDDGIPWLAVIEWDDGSRAYVGWYGADLTLSEESAVRVAVDTGERVQDAYHAFIVIPGVDQQIEVWTHLGFDHLLEVVGALRATSG